MMKGIYIDKHPIVRPRVPTITCINDELKKLFSFSIKEGKKSSARLSAAPSIISIETAEIENPIRHKIKFPLFAN